MSHFVGRDVKTAFKNNVIPCGDIAHWTDPKGGYFIQDIIGAEVVTESGESVGKLTEVIDAPASMVYVVKGERERLIPAVPEFILRTDADTGVITVRLIEGM